MKRSLLALLGAGALLALVGCKVDADFSDVAPKPVILAAEEYRSEITGIDRLVFDAAPVTKARGAALGAALDDLAARVKAASPEKFLAIEALELRALAGRARSLPDGPPPGQLRNEWMRIRNNLFDDRAWFARSAADLGPPDAAPPPEPPAAPARLPDLAPGEPPSAAPATAERLDGRWTVKEVFANGTLRSDDELSGATWTFSEGELVIRSARGTASRYAVERVADDHGKALRLRTIETSAGPAEQGWMIYQLSGATLNVAFFDGLGARPDGFVPPEGHPKPLLLMIVLAR